jgi:hypothetical protein
LKHVELIEPSTFTRQITALLSDEDYGAFQSRLAANPGLGALIKGGSGIRRIRVGFGSRGKSGRPRHLLLPKNVSADLIPKQVEHLAKAVKEEFRDETENI